MTGFSVRKGEQKGRELCRSQTQISDMQAAMADSQSQRSDRDVIRRKDFSPQTGQGEQMIGRG
jgi:hypothetical protein